MSVENPNSWRLTAAEIEQAKSEAKQNGATHLVHFHVHDFRNGQQMEFAAGLNDGKVEKYLESIRFGWLENRKYVPDIKKVAVYTLV